MSGSEKKVLQIGSYITLDGEEREVVHHPTDFSVDASRPKVQELLSDLPKDSVRQLSIGMSRVAAIDSNGPEETMKTVRERNVAHHIYRLADTGEEIVIADRIFLRLKEVDSTDLESVLAQHKLMFAILMEYKLILEKQTANRYTLKVTSDSGCNPLKIANEIAKRKDVVEACVPEILMGIQFGSLCSTAFSQPSAAQHSLFADQWHLASAAPVDPSLDPSINVVAAWDHAGCFGNPDIVIAVIDDGFDLPVGAKPSARHSAFTGTIVDTEHMKDFDPSLDLDHPELDPVRNPRSRGDDFHGTCVASLIFASESPMLGVAPCCKFLPIRVGDVSVLKPSVLLGILTGLSKLADVVNCSFAMKPQSYSVDNLDAEFLPGIEELIKSGGKRPGNKGLVIVFASGNDNAPICMSAEDNKNGITFVRKGGFGAERFTLGPHMALHCVYAGIKGAVVVGAITSTKRKAAYSNWGAELTVVAPSDNGHELTELDLNRDDPMFQTRFPGLGIVSAVNQSLNGSELPPQPKRPTIKVPIAPGATELHPYTRSFGGTSAAAAIVSGVIGLMLSVNVNLTPEDIIEILTKTADNKVDDNLVDLEEDLNLRDINGAFGADNRSLFFGAGKVDAAEAVKEAKKKLGGATAH